MPISVYCVPCPTTAQKNHADMETSPMKHNPLGSELPALPQITICKLSPNPEQMHARGDAAHLAGLPRHNGAREHPLETNPTTKCRNMWGIWANHQARDLGEPPLMNRPTHATVLSESPSYRKHMRGTPTTVLNSTRLAPGIAHAAMRRPVQPAEDDAATGPMSP